MRTFVWLSLLLAGCPPPPRYVIADVLTAGAPVHDALVAAECGGPDTQPARRTGDNGRARLALAGDADPARCTLTVASPGFRTVEVPAAHACTPPLACPPIAVWLQPEGMR